MPRTFSPAMAAACLAQQTAEVLLACLTISGDGLDTFRIVTGNSFRCIASESDLLPVEQAADEVPAWLIDVIAGNEVRRQRDALLLACDWTQMPDVPLDAEARSAWATYRQALRDLPEQPGFPHAVEWPVPPTGGSGA